MSTPLGHFSRVITAALQLRATLLADGTSEVETDRIVGEGLKTAWGVPDRGPWLYVCKRCRDTGWREALPDADRWRILYGTSTEPAPSYVKCDTDCAYLVRERRKRRDFDTDDVAAAGRTVRGRK